MTTRIDKLTIRLTGVTAAQGREVADRLGKRLAAQIEGYSGSIETLRLTLNQDSLESPERIADRIAGAVARALAASR